MNYCKKHYPLYQSISVNRRVRAKERGSGKGECSIVDFPKTNVKVLLLRWNRLYIKIFTTTGVKLSSMSCVMNCFKYQKSIWCDSNFAHNNCNVYSHTYTQRPHTYMAKNQNKRDS